MGTSVISEMGTLIKDHPYISCSLLIFLTPPFFPILKFFSPLLISTALFIVALVTMGPQFEDPSDQEGDLQRSLEIDAEVNYRAGDGRRDVKTTNSGKGIHFSPSDWIKSCKESGIAWMEQKLFRNDNWRASSLNDENVSILQEAFANRVEEKPHMMMKLIPRRIPAEEERVTQEHSFRRQDVPDLLNSGSWKSSHSPDRSFESVGTNTRDLSHDFFSPHPSFSRRHDSGTPLFENFEPPPIEHDMPPLITGPASVTAPLFRSFEDDIDSDDKYDHHHSDHDEHMHLEVGERSLDADSLSQDKLPVTNGTYDQPSPFTVQEEDLPSSSDSDEECRYLTDWHQGDRATESSLSTMYGEVHNCDTDLHEQQPAGALESHEISAPHSKDVFEERSPSADILDEERPIPAQKIDLDSHPLPTAGHEESLVLNKDVEVHDIPELEDDLLVEKERPETPVAAGESSTWREFVAESHSGDHFDTDVEPGDVPASHVLEVPTDHATTSKELHNEPEVPSALKDVSVEPHHSIDRSMSLPVVGSLAAAYTADLATAHEDLTQSDKSLPDDVQEPAQQSYALSSAISLPVGRSSMQPISIPPKTPNQGPLSPDTDLGYATSPDHERRGAARFFSAERFNSITSFSGDESELALPAKQLSTKEKLSNIEALCNSMPSPASGERRCFPADQVAILRATTDEQVTHVTGKLKDFMDSSSKKFQPDAPQLQITPPSTKIVLNAPPSKSAILASALGRPSIRPVVSSSRTYGGARFSSSEESSEDEQIDLDSDIEADGTDSNSDFEIVEPTGKSRIKAPPKPPAKIREP
ncbi:hypothetical protein KC19_1G177100 [Ceratodon purpureus]|uniref:Uncharacterized protein n=1 Tax=Ceratodon purpureus TaxID=3225 RepID=A0A8T0J8A8_CERPU|nr:hypothetical protein KC19_1G177100 [Ceratodon purpureus]